MSRSAWFSVCLYVVCSVFPLAAQNNYLYATGSPPFGVDIPIEGGFINIANGNVHIEIPLATTPQRGNLQLDEKLVYDSRIWQIVDNGSLSWQPTNVPNSMAGWRFMRGNEIGNIGTNLENYDSLSCPQAQTDDDYAVQLSYWYSWTDPSGTEHDFDTIWVINDTGGACYTAPNQEYNYGWALDSSGYQIKENGTDDGQPNVTILDKTGNQVYPQVVDRFGNYFSSDGNGNLVDDLGRTPVTTTYNGNQIDYTVLTTGGNTATYTVTTNLVNVSTDFNEEAVQEWSGSLYAIQSIQLPDGSSYSFNYDAYGGMTSMTLPTGGTVSLGYSNYSDSYINENRWLTSYTGGYGSFTFSPSVITFCSGQNSYVGCQEQMKATDADGNDTVYELTLDNGAWDTSTTYYQGQQSSGQTLLNTADGFDFSQECQDGICIGAEYINPSGTVTTLGNGLNSALQYGYSSAETGQITSAKVWDYYSGSQPSAPTVDDEYTYADATDLGQAKTLDGAGNQVALVNYSYNGNATATSGLTGHNASLGTSGPYLSSVTQGVGTTLTTNFTNDDTGAQLTSTDPNGQVSFGRDATDTYVTGMTPPPPSSGVALPQSASYDPSTGLLLSTTDPNNETTTYSGYDWAGRVGQISYPNGGTEAFSYPSPNQVGDLRTMNSSTEMSKQTLVDGYGRLSRVAVYNGQATNPWYQTDYCYGADGRLAFQSYRYQGQGFVQGMVCSGAGDSYNYDALGRVTQITHGDGSSISYQYSGRATEVTDENGVSRITQVDALGRTTAVCEISSNGSLPGSGSPVNCGLDLPGTGFLTTYSYNLAGHTTTVTEGAQTRVFQTDSLGRAISVQEPESGITTYSYAYNGTGLQVTRQRPQANQSNPNALTTTTTQYDAVGRPVSVSYSDGTPAKSFAYDQANMFGGSVSAGASKGELTSVSVNVGGSTAATAYSYDAAGNVTSTDECLPSGCGNAAEDKWSYYSYDWLGNLTSLQDSSGVTTSYTYSPASEVQSITSSLDDATHPPNLVSNVQNGPFGPTSYQLGNGLSEALTYDQLGRLNGQWVCSGSSQPYCTGGTQLYGFLATFWGARNEGICDTVINKCEGFGYDEFNRLTLLSVNTGTVQNYTYTYDRYGNRWQQNALQGGWTSSLSFNTANNEINTSGYAYDAAGDLTNDGNHSYSYDAEGNLTQVDGGNTATYQYDALNERVTIDEGGNFEGFVYNQNSQRASIWNLNSGAEMRGETYWGGMPVEFNYNNQANFQHQDWTGTDRMFTDYAGNVEGTVASLPFGDGSGATGSGFNPWVFANLDKDYYGGADSGTDHAQYREYSDGQGNWMSPDPYSGSYNFTNPQSFNRYSYVMNNPMTFTDPSGLLTLVAQPQSCNLFCYVFDVGIEAIAAGIEAGLEDLFHFGGGPSFHGSLQPRPEVTTSVDDGYFESDGIYVLQETVMVNYPPMPHFAFNLGSGTSAPNNFAKHYGLTTPCGPSASQV